MRRYWKKGGDCRFSASKNGRRLAARRLRPFVLCAISSASFAASPSASRRASRLRERRRPLPPTWRGRRGGQALELRGSLFPSRSRAPANLSGHGEENLRAFFGEPITEVSRAGIADPLPLDFGNGEFDFIPDVLQGVRRIEHDADFFRSIFVVQFAFLFHFLSPVRPGAGLVLFSDYRIPNRLGIVNRINAKKIRFFNGRNRRHLRAHKLWRRAEARPQNASGEGREV